MMSVATATIPALTADLLTGGEWSSEQIRELYHLAADIKARPERYRSALAGRFLALIFEKPSLRTRVTFEVGISSMGGGAVFLDHTQSRLGERESVSDVARNLDRWVQGIVARVFEHQVLEELAENASIPIINALSERCHPCQAYADFFTLEERFGNLRGLKLAYIGDGNNVCHSLLTVGSRLGIHLRVATPTGYEPDAAVVSEARRSARENRAKIEITHSPEEAVSGVLAVYTDVWASMGQEQESDKREKAFAGYQVDSALLEHADPQAVFMHCLPAHRGSEVSAEVLNSPRSIVFEQAENRLHVQKAILLNLLG
jgi:ornithine carbamoyltransferase